MSDKYITDGFETVVEDYGWIANNLQFYKDFDTAAPLINPTWKRHHIHKEIKQGRILKSSILIVHDTELYGIGYSKGKKYFLHEDEIERLKNEVAERPRREVQRCRWCYRLFRYCYKKPCPDRTKNSPEYQESVERVAEHITTFLKKRESKRRPFSELNKHGEQKRFKTR